MTIVGYAVVTDSERVRHQAEAYLSRLVGGPAEVQAASLSLFEGLRLEGVTVSVPTGPEEASEGHTPPDAVLFTARSVRIDYNPLDLLLGKISATRVIAVDPHVRLTEDVDSETWNFQRLQRRRREQAEQGDERFDPPDELPEILLRNAQVDYARIVDGQLVPRGSVGIEAQLRPAIAQEGTPQEDHGAYRFAVQTRGLAGVQGMAGPQAQGVIDLHAGNLTARLDDVDFAALRDILPRAAAEWWRQHGISGRLDVPQIRLDWENPVMMAGPDGALERVPSFRVEVRLDEAQLQGLPEEWLPREEVDIRREMTQWLASASESARSPRLRNILARMADQTQMRPLRLRNVSGGFVFTHRGLHVNGLKGDFEGNRLRVDGVIDGYSADAAISMVVQNADDALEVPDNVPYISSLPRQVREVYHRFLPQGRCRLRLELHRPAAAPDGEPVRPIVTGYVDVQDGTFTLDRFPYPVRNAQGRLLLRYDRQTQQDQLIIENLRGFGLAGGPNENARISIDGVVGPLTSVAGFDISVSGRNVSDEPAIIAALPPPAQEAIANFDPVHHGRGAGGDGGPPPPMSFAGDFLAEVKRPPGPRQKWDFRVDLYLREMSGAFVGFPYPLENASAEVRVFPDHVEIARAQMRRAVTHNATPIDNGASATAGMAEVGFRGRVDWGRREEDEPGDSRPPLRVDLTVSGRNLPTDAALMGALPPDAVAQLSALGLGGRADVEARVFTDAQDELTWDVTLDVTDGRFWPETGAFSLASAAGRVRVLPDRVELSHLTGRRGAGTITVDGTIGMGEGGLTEATLSAQNLTLDTAIYDLLPQPARDAWDWLRPAGATDALVTYRGPTGLFFGDAEQRAAAAAGVEPEYEVILRPQGASATPASFPYALDNLHGTLKIVPGRIELFNVTADHALAEGEAPATLAVSGVGRLGAAEDGGDIWELSPQIAGAPLDESLMTALPDGLAETLSSLKATGVVTAAFEKLTITTHPLAGVAPPAPTTQEAAPVAAAEAPVDVDFSVRVTAAGASADVGVPLSELHGRIDLSGSYRDGRLRSLAGTFLGDQFSVRGRKGSELHGTIHLPEDGRTLSVSNLSAAVAGGRLGGNVTLTFGEAETDPTRYELELAVREANVRQLVGEQAGRSADFSGNLTARLDIEGTFGEAASRRGRGEVIVSGEKLYDLPLVLGLLQVTNLAMPVAEPFREATAAFTVDGQEIVFDQIALRAADMEMNGQGTLSFETQKVNLSFTTSNHGWAQVPLVGDLVGLARNELLRIHVRGTLQSPEVSGSTLPTITSTIDEVFRRD